MKTKLLVLFLNALTNLRRELQSQRHYVKPQFLIDDDDEYQDALEASWDNNETIDPIIEEIDKLLDDRMIPDISWFENVTALLQRNNFTITIKPNK